MGSRRCPFAARLGRGGSPRGALAPSQPTQGVRLFFLSQRQKPAPSRGIIFPSPGSRPGCRQPLSAMASCPCSHPGSDFHPGHQPTGSSQLGTGSPHPQFHPMPGFTPSPASPQPRLPAAPRSGFSCCLFTLAAASRWSQAFARHRAPTQPRGNPGWVPRATPQHPQPSSLPPKATLPGAEAGSPSPSCSPRGLQLPPGFGSSPSSVPAAQQTPGKSLCLLTPCPPWEYQIPSSCAESRLCSGVEILMLRYLRRDVLVPSGARSSAWDRGTKMGQGHKDGAEGQRWSRGTRSCAACCR